MYDFLGVHGALDGIILEFTKNKLKVFFQPSGSVFLLCFQVEDGLKEWTYGIYFFLNGHPKHIENRAVRSIF